MKRIVIIFLLLLSLGFKCNRNAPKEPSNNTPVSDSIISSVEIDTTEESSISNDNPTISHASMDYKYGYFGTIGYRDRTFNEDTLLYPPIPGLIHRSVFKLCPVDTCYAEYLTLALRCPQKNGLQEWLNNRVYQLVDSCANSIDKGAHYKIKQKRCATTKEILNHYLNELEKAQSQWACPHYTDEYVINEQSGRLIVDCWQSGDLYTFYETGWYDMLSCGNNVWESYITVDSQTGRELKIEDFVPESKYYELFELVTKHLCNEDGKRWIDIYDLEHFDSSVLKRADGCGLIREGFIIFFHPYKLGSGAEGEYKAIIPYDELDGVLII